MEEKKELHTDDSLVVIKVEGVGDCDSIVELAYNPSATVTMVCPEMSKEVAESTVRDFLVDHGMGRLVTTENLERIFPDFRVGVCERTVLYITEGKLFVFIHMNATSVD